jgi:hypothetical protein
LDEVTRYNEEDEVGGASVDSSRRPMILSRKVMKM